MDWRICFIATDYFIGHLARLTNAVPTDSAVDKVRACSGYLPANEQPWEPWVARKPRSELGSVCRPYQRSEKSGTAHWSCRWQAPA